MDKIEWGTPKLEVLSTRQTAAGGGGGIDVFHTDGTGNDVSPSGDPVGS